MEITVAVSIVALLVSAVTAAFSLSRTEKRDRVDALDKICDQQWIEIDNLKADKIKLERDLQVFHAVSTAKIDTNAAEARLAILEANKANELAYKTAEGNARALTEISETGRATHKIVNNQRTVMLRQIAVLSRLYAKDHPNDLEAQKAAEQAEQDAKMAQQDHEEKQALTI